MNSFSLETQKKILSMEEGARYCADCRANGEVMVVAHGCFDVLHLGHVRHLGLARAEGDHLIVSITDDDFVNKGPGRPYFTARIRAEMLASLDIVDAVVINHAPSAVPMLNAIRPSIYVKGSEYSNPSDDVTGKIVDEKNAVEAHGGRIAFTEDVVYSSSALINKHFSDVYSDELRVYLDGLRDRKSADDFSDVVDSVQGLKCLVIGDAIMDEYIYVHSMAKASKENIIATRYSSDQLFAGGVMATANHVASMCDTVEMLTCLGAERTDLETINASLKPNVKMTYITRPGAATTRKTRYIDKSYWKKLFEVYDFDDEPLEPAEQKAFDALALEKIKQYDVVIVNDFGHGLIAPSTMEIIQKEARFLTLNAQTNAANVGYNLITKYERADFICIDAPEARMAVGDKHSPIEEIVHKIAKRLHCPNIVVTHGEHGCLVYQEGKDVIRIPAFTKSVVDTVGAGDAFFAMTSPLVAKGVCREMVGVVGNAAGATKVGIVGHSKSVEKPALLNCLKAMLK